MSAKQFKFIVTGGAFVLLVLHLFSPKLGIDYVTIGLLFILALPWIGPILKGLAASGVKTLELPGGIKIELADVKSATDKIIRGSADITLPVIRLDAAATASGQIEVADTTSFDYIREVANTDANLGLVAFRIEVEKRIRRLADVSGIKTRKGPLNQLVKQLLNVQVLTPSMANGLIELIALGNQAAHGIEVSENAAAWVLDVGPSIIIEIDTMISKLLTKNKSLQSES